MLHIIKVWRITAFFDFPKLRNCIEITYAF